MIPVRLNSDQITTLAALANGVIPPDEIDDGAAAVKSGPRIAEKINNGINTALYLQGLETAGTVSKEKFGRPVSQLNPRELHELIGVVRDQLPGFFKQLRMDVSALYLSDPEVWQHIGFPGPSTASGGYPDFDRPQTARITRLKEGPL